MAEEPESVNTRLRDGAVRATIRTLRVSKAIAADIRQLLEASEQDLVAILARRLRTIEERGFDRGPATTKRLQALLAAIREQQAELDKQILAGLKAGLDEVVMAEARLTAAELRAELPPTIDVTRAPAPLLHAVVSSDPIHGRILKDWVKGMGDGRVKALEQAIQIGLVQGESVEALVTRIRGTKRLAYSDGVLEVSRRWATTVARTAATHVSNRARIITFEQNADVLAGWVFTAVLDSRTTLVCISNDLKVFPIGEGPLPPLHPGCRSSASPLTRSWRSLGIPASELDEGTRASLDGQVPASTSYAKFLAKQSAAFQDDVLGPARGRMFRAGTPVEKFVDARLRPLTLDQLKAML